MSGYLLGATRLYGTARGIILFAGPAGHVKTALWGSELEAASKAGYVVSDGPSIRRSHSALLKKVKIPTAERSLESLESREQP